LELGHEVRYVATQPSAEDSMASMRRELVDHMFGSASPSADGADLLILVDVFGDRLYHQHAAGGAGAEDYRERLQRYRQRAAAAERTLVLDMSDRRQFREVVFEELPNVQMFARESLGDHTERWRPFPFLYNLPMLWLEYLQPETSWLVREGRSKEWDWVFCGTIQHPRYEHRRELAIDLLARRWPDLRGLVISHESYQDVLGALQSARAGLDLPGLGEVCFRLHECLALGTPVWRPFANEVALPPGLGDVIVKDPKDLRITEVDDVRDLYQQHYAPRASATWLLERLEAAPSGRRAAPARA